jgi:hypothetical protein
MPEVSIQAFGLIPLPSVIGLVWCLVVWLVVYWFVAGALERLSLKWAVNEERKRAA